MQNIDVDNISESAQKFSLGLMRRSLKWLNYLFFFLLGILSSLYLSYSSKTFPETLLILTKPLEEIGALVALFLFICIAGGFGGLLSSFAENGQLDQPWFGKKRIVDENLTTEATQIICKLGWLGDCLVGIGAGFVAVLIIPGNFEFPNTMAIENIKLFATALIGGYGGRKLLDQALSRTVAETKEKAEQAVRQASSNLSEAKKLAEQAQQRDEESKELARIQAQLQEQAKYSAIARRLLSRYLDSALELSEEEKQILEDSIKKSSSETRTYIFAQTQRFLYEQQAHLSKEDTPDNVYSRQISLMMIKRTKDILEFLKKEDDSENHRYYAHVGYVWMSLDSEDGNSHWQNAIEQLNQAIELRNKLNLQNFWIYEFNRAICQIELEGYYQNYDKELNVRSNESVCQAILNDLEKVKCESDETLETTELLQAVSREKHQITKWLAMNKLSTNLQPLS